MLSSNQILQNRYRIVRQLGRGGMGAVYEAIDERFGEPIALKEIIIESSDPYQKNLILKAFEREAKSLAKASHESIPFVRDYFSELNHQFLVMELVEGGDLGELLYERKSPFLLEDALRWLSQILDALDYLHTLQPPIIHRDIKPQNLKLNSRQKIKLLDFGIAKSNDASSTITSHTFAGATLEYSPIEQILPAMNPTFREFIVLKHKEESERILRQNTDERCDIYAVGATFYQLLTNQSPVDATKRALDTWSGNPDPLPSPSVLNPLIPTLVSDCLLKAMAIEREDRFSSASEMQIALQEEFVKIPHVIHSQSFQTSFTRELPEISERKEIPNISEAIPIEEISDAESGSYTKPAFVDFTFPTGSDFTAPKSVELSKSTEKFTDENNVSAANFAKESVEIYPKKKNNLSWLLPIAALLVLTVGGISGMIWLTNSPSVNPTDSAGNSNISDKVEASPTPVVSQTTEPESVSDTITVNESDNLGKTKLSDESNSSKTPLPSALKRIDRKDENTVTETLPANKKQPILITPKSPTPKSPNKKPTQDPNCVFTNSCS